MPRGRRRNNGSQLRFNRKLVLHQWMLGLFGVERFEQLAEHLKDADLEGLDENNVHRFHAALTLHLPAAQRPELPDDLLLEYDQAIVSVTLRLNERRITRGERPIVWKYFQYLALLFTEIYLDRYFRDPAALRASLNAYIAAFNERVGEGDRITPFDQAEDPHQQLNKIAFWMATGSGKTLLMHAHILQFRRYLETHNRARELNRVILLTPNEGLSRQHLEEFLKSGIDAEIFDKDGRGVFAGHAVEILEVTKLKEEMGEKTVAVDAFEGNNLVLVDEGHRGTSSGGDGTWMRYRNALCEKGFSFEYSATFGQAVRGNPALTDLYARSTLFDYSYRWFYGDGFGKDYHILNIEDDRDADWLKTYLTACLLAFFQQQRLFREREAEFRPFDIERPLWIFVGGSVTATLASRDASDIIEILKFLAGYVNDRADSVERIRGVLHEGLVTAGRKNLFAGSFAYLNTTGLTPARLFEESLALLFNAPAGGALHVENLKGAAGEIALRVGENEPFGVINVGDDAKLMKLCEANGLHTAEREFSGSLFQELTRSDSRVNVLIGSRKFTEGWNIYRVSTMGLMNIGRGEGAQIIQLFGRGVRLKGYDTSLKRSGQITLPPGLERPKYIEMLETLQIFGIRADYMAQFRDFLDEEGLPTDDDQYEIVLPIRLNLGTVPLKTLQLKKEIRGVSTEHGNPFRKLGPVPTVQPPDPVREPRTEYLRKNQVVLNWYPKIQAIKSAGVKGGDEDGVPEQAHFDERHIAFLDIDRIYFELERYKADRGWHNLNITRAGIRQLLADHTWYQLFIPESAMAFDSFERVRTWQEIAVALLRKYVERYYTFRKREWELPHLEYRDLTEDDPNFPTISRETGTEYGYRIVVDKSREEVIQKLEELGEAIKRGDLRTWEFPGIRAIPFGRHLYEPLLYVEGGVVTVAPQPLNKGERRFVEDLKAFYDAHPQLFVDQELYLLRNQSKGRGLGFFEAGNFHPDFIVWQVIGGKQRVAFVDPKGLLHLGPTDPKINFHQTVKEIEQRLGDPTISLESFIVSSTPSQDLRRQWTMEKPEMLRRNILFPEEDRNSYVGTLLGLEPAIAGS